VLGCHVVEGPVGGAPALLPISVVGATGGWSPGLIGRPAPAVVVVVGTVGRHLQQLHHWQAAAEGRGEHGVLWQKHVPNLWA
jgi:hypothetical protein